MVVVVVGVVVVDVVVVDVVVVDVVVGVVVLVGPAVLRMSTACSLAAPEQLASRDASRTTLVKRPAIRSTVLSVTPQCGQAGKRLGEPKVGFNRRPAHHE